MSSVIVQSTNSKAYSGFSPRDVPATCALWLDAADANTVIRTGSTVTQWNDKSGNGNNATAGTSPSYNTSGINNLGVISFNGSSTFLNTQDVYSQRSFAVFVVVRRQASNLGSGSGNFPIIGGSATSNNANFHLTWVNSVDTTLRMGFYGNDLNYTSFPAYSGSAATEPAYLIMAYYTPGTRQIFVNGTLAASDGNGTNLSSSTGMTLGRFPISNSFFNGFIGEYIVFNGALSSSLRQQVEGYLARKWGLLSTLPATQPYKSLPLFTRPFQPTDVDGCIVWLDASDVSTLTLSGTNVTEWRDKSGNGNTATAGGSVFPVYQANGLNSLSFIQMRASSDYLTINNNLTVASYPDLCYIVVARYANSQPSNIVGVISADRALGIGNNGTSVQQQYYGNVQNVANITAETWAVIALQGSGAATLGNGTVTVNGTASTAYGWGTGTNTGGIRIGSYNSGGGANGSFDIAEILIYVTNLSTAQRQQIESYLAWKWGLQNNLASGQLFKLYRPTTPLFTPLAVSGCGLWLDAADSSTLTLSGSSVTQWNDKSGNGRNTSSVTGTPTLTSNSLNSLPGIYFNGSQNMSGAFVYTSNTLSYFIISTTESDTTRYGRTFSIGTSGTNDFDNISSMACLARETIPNTLYMQRNNASVSSVSQTYSVPFLVSATLDGTNLVGYLNGTQIGSVANSGNFNTSVYTLSIGLPTSFNQRNKGFIYEIVMYTAALTSTQRQLVEGYLAWKWGLQNSLPTSHPYYKVRV